MKHSRLLSIVLSLSMLLSLAASAGAANTEKSWWTDDYWDLATLQSFGAAPPIYNPTTHVYEISTPEQLLYVSGSWKAGDANRDGAPDAPRNGSYVLTKNLDMSPLMKQIGTKITAASGVQTEGYMSPLSSAKDENADKTDGWFLGTFDGNYHTISNLNIARTAGKYAGLFGYVGNDADHATIKNLGLSNIHVTGSKSCGAIAGVSYGAIENCFATGTITAKETVGGLVGKVKEGLHSHVTNCFSYMDIHCQVLTGGIAGTQDSGGTIDSCYAAGSIITGDDHASTGGAVGSFSAGEWLKNTVALQRSIAGGKNTQDTDRLVGSLASESGVNIVNNFVWEGTQLSANEPAEHPSRAIAQYKSATDLLSRSLYRDTLGWDLSSTWSWIGSDQAGCPMLSGFVKAKNAPDLLGKLKEDLTLTNPVLNLDNPTVSFVAKDEKPVITATLVMPAGSKAEAVKVYYGKTPDGTAFTDSSDMLYANGKYTCSLPLKEFGTYYYYVKATAGGKELTKPYNIGSSIKLTLDDGKVDGSPREIVCQVGETYSEVGFNWLTDPAVTDSKVWYRKKGSNSWTVANGKSALHYLTAGWEETQSHWATATGLAPKTTYEYSVGGTYNGLDYKSPIYTFTTLPDTNAFTFMQYSDMQAESVSGYDPFVKTLSDFVDKLPTKPDFLLNTGDIVASGYKTSEWSNFFTAAQHDMANRLHILLPGNHENKGDLLYQQYGARTSLPNEDEYAALEGTGWCKIGNACIVFVNTDPYSGQTGADVVADRERYFREQTAWAKQIFESSGCTWRIIASHIGTYIVNWKDPTEYPYIPNMCDELNVDLYINGHDHEYIRTSVKNFKKTTIGQGTTYVTASSLGEKLDAFIPDSAGGKYAEVHKDGAANAQQIFSMVTVDDNGIHLTAYQRGSSTADYKVIDRFDITTSLTKGPQAQTTVSAPTTAAAPTAVSPATATPASSETTYIVVYGDSLYKIAEHYYGDGRQWRKIYEANRSLIKNPNLIYVNQSLKIP